MNDDQIQALLSAARVLSEVGRASSARSLLDNVARQAPDALRSATLSTARRVEAELTCLAAEALIDAGRRKDAQMAWSELVAAAGRQRTPLDPAMLRLRLALIEPSLHPPAHREGDPELAYILGLSLPQDKTGYAMRTQALVSAMQAQGRSVVCLTKPGFPWDRGHADAGRQDRVGDIVYHRTGDTTDRPARLPADYLAAEEKVLAALSPLRPKWVMAASNYTTAIPALFAARRLGLSFVYEVRGFWELSRASREPGYMNSVDYRAARDLDGAVAAQADLVFTLNSAMRDDLIGRGVDPGRIALLPNAADTEALRPAPRDAALSRRLGLRAEVPVIGYVGSFTDYEGLDDLVAACAGLAASGLDFRLLIVGADPRGESRISTRLRQMAADLGLADRVILTGLVPPEQVAAWYSLIDIAPIPRRRFPVTELVSPLKPREAMAMGKAVIVSDLDPLAEMVRSGVTGAVFPAGDRHALARVLARLISNPAYRRALGDAARRDVVANHRWSVRAETCWRALGRVETRLDVTN